MSTLYGPLVTLINLDSSSICPQNGSGPMIAVVLPGTTEIYREPKPMLDTKWIQQRGRGLPLKGFEALSLIASATRILHTFQNTEFLKLICPLHPELLL